MKVTVVPALPSLCRVKPVCRSTVRVGLVQHHYDADPSSHEALIAEGIRVAAENGASIVFLPELTLSRYPADVKPIKTPNEQAETLRGGRTHVFVAEQARKNNVLVHASLYEKHDFPTAYGSDGRGINAAILVNPAGEIIAHTPKLHIPVTAGYYEDLYFQPGPAVGPSESKGEPYPVYDVNLADVKARLGLPTCWDQWFPEVARSYALNGADIIAYPTAIGSEPDYPDFDTEPLWRQVIIGHGIANGTFMVVANRWADEGALKFYGSSFISDPFGRVLARAGRDTDEVIVADLDLDQRRDWLDLFPFFATRRPDTYASLTKEVCNPRDENGDGVDGGIAGIPAEAIAAHASITEGDSIPRENSNHESGAGVDKGIAGILVERKRKSRGTGDSDN